MCCEPYWLSKIQLVGQFGHRSSTWFYELQGTGKWWLSLDSFVCERNWGRTYWGLPHLPQKPVIGQCVSIRTKGCTYLLDVSVLVTVWAETKEEVVVLRIWSSSFPMIFLFHFNLPGLAWASRNHRRQGTNGRASKLILMPASKFFHVLYKLPDNSSSILPRFTVASCG